MEQKPALGTSLTSNTESGADFDTLNAAVNACYGSMPGYPLFTTDAQHLFNAFLAHLPATERQHHTCHACRKFVEAFGGLVVIGADGGTVPVMWDHSNVPRLYACAVEAMQRIVEAAKVTGVFLSSAKVWGQPVTGPWSHLAVTPPASALFHLSVKTAGQAMAEKLQDYLTLLKALDEFSLDALSQAVIVLRSDVLYRSEKCLGAAEWLKNLQEQRQATGNSRRRANILWRAVAGAPPGFCHPRAGMIGTLLEDILSGLPFETIARRFAEKMNPLRYQRPQAAPAAGNIAQAEKIVAQMGIAAALRRRFARLDEVEAIWRPAARNEERRQEGVFSHLKPRSREVPTVNLPVQTMTWVKFAANVLPDARRIEFQVPQGRQAYSALLTAADPEALPILQWDMPASRNPVSWYVYQVGSLPAAWQLSPGTRCMVTAVCLQPSTWHGAQAGHQGESVFFLLSGCRDLRYKDAGNALFPEILKSELYGVRSTIEAFSRDAVIEGEEQASACGVRLQRGNSWQNCVFRVTSGDGGVASYQLDRWD